MSKKTKKLDPYEEMKQLILEESMKGNIVLMTCEGLMISKLEQILNQKIEGILYDLNRDPATILTLIRDRKWVNDYACMKVITLLHKKWKKAEAKEEKFKEIIDSIERRIIDKGDPDCLQQNTCYELYERDLKEIFKLARKELKEAVK